MFKSVFRYVITMTDIERLTVRIDRERLNSLQKLVDSGKYCDISSAVRAAIDRFIQENGECGDDIKTVPLELLTEDSSVDFDQAVKNAVSDYIRNKIQTR